MGGIMFEEIKSIQKTQERTAHILKKMMDTKEFRTPNHAFVVLRATMKVLRDRIEPGEALHLGGQLPALLRGYYFEGFDITNIKQPKSSCKGINEFFGEIRDYLEAYDFMDLEKVVPIALNIILDNIDRGEAAQVVHQLPKDLQELRSA
jgi:uncharacterized protein (DUF2267 family)